MALRSLKQIYHPYDLWEDWKAGMWRSESLEYESNELPKIIEFTGDYIQYGAAMIQVINHWPYSCEHNLSNISINRKAWIGHAACCIKFAWPEYLVRKAWWMLTDRQRVLADNEALKAIYLWEQRQRSKGISKHGSNVVTPMVYQMRLPLI